MAADPTTDATLGELRSLLEANDRTLLDLVMHRRNYLPDQCVHLTLL